nr:MAG TPA: hypothetical protein [Caudoviricetes sp.]
MSSPYRHHIWTILNFFNTPQGLLPVIIITKTSPLHIS